MKKKLFSDELIACWDCFNTEMIKHGYRLIINDDPAFHEAGFGTIAFKNDKYSPIIQLHCFSYDDKISIEVNDRHGNPILGEGRTLGYYRFSDLGVVKVKEACKHIIAVFGKYDIDNPVPTKFETEEISY